MFVRNIRPLPSEALQPASRAVLVTGGTGSIGREIVRMLCANGYLAFANYASDEQRALTVQNETGCELRRADVGSEEDVAALMARLPPLFGIVHAAGIARDALLLRQSSESWAETMRVNSTGGFLIARAALDKLEDGGRLVLLASRVGENGNAGQGAYAAAKAGLIGLMRTAAREGAQRKLAVNAVCPGFVPSSMTEELGASEQQAFRNRSILGEFGTAGQVAGLVLWLLSEAAAGVTGQLLHCDSRIQ